VEVDEDTDPKVGDDAGMHPESSSVVKPRHKKRAVSLKQSASMATTKVQASKTAKLEAEKKKKRKRKTSPPPVVETPVIPTPPSRKVKSDDEEDEATYDPPVVEDQTVKRSFSPAAKRQRMLEPKTTEDDLRQGLEA
jgi:hypothetical protein